MNIFSTHSTMVEFKPLDNEMIRRLDCDGCHGHINVCVPRWNQPDKIKKMFIIDKYIPMYQQIKDMEVYEDDHWVLSYPKCGTTWYFTITYFDLNVQLMGLFLGLKRWCGC